MDLNSEIDSQLAPFNVSSLKAIIFDFDGTLVDSEPVWKSTFFDLFKAELGVEVPMEILWANTGGGVDLSVTNISNKLELGMNKAQIAEMAHNLHEEMQRKILEELPLRDGAIEVFDWAISNNVVMGVCTASTTELIDGFFKKLGLREMFAQVVSTAVSDLEHRKPYPFPYLESMRLLNVSPHESLAIEDSPSGVTSAVTAGITTIAIHNPFLEVKVLEAKPKYVFEGFPQVLELLCP